MNDLIQLITNFDTHLDKFVQSNGAWTYALAGAIVFAETGFVVLPFLPGDSLLFALGAIAARNGPDSAASVPSGPLLNLWLMMGVLILAAVLGNSVNYLIGRRVGSAAVNSGRVKFIKKSHLDRTHSFFEKHGGKAVVISRFIPIIRTVAPFVAGAGEMNMARYQSYNLLGALLWVVACTVAGYFFGNLPIVREHFSMVVLGIIVVSMIPVVVSAFQARRSSHPAADAAAVPASGAGSPPPTTRHGASEKSAA